MKRDMDLIRTILLAVESNPHGFAPQDLEIEGYSKQEVAYHSYLIGDEGLAVTADTTSLGSSGPEARIVNLTSYGHNFLEAAREPGRWSQAKEIVDVAGGASIKIWMSVLTDLVKQSLGI